MFKRFKKLKRGFMIEPEEIFLDSLNSLGFDQTRHEGRLEYSLRKTSLFRFLAFLFLGFLILFGRVTYLQIIQGKFFSAKAREQSLLIAYTLPPHGNITDRNGVILAGNKISFDLVFYPSEFLRSDLELIELNRRLSEILEISEAELIVDGFPKNEKDFLPQITFARNVNKAVLAKIQTERENLPGVFIEERFSRKYEGGPAFAALIGYLGLATPEEYQERNREINFQTLTGKLGLEREYDKNLRGVQGKKIIQVNATRSVQKIKTIEDAKSGPTLKLFLYADLQKKAYDVLANHIKQNGKRAGALVAVDPRNGSVLALVSYPSFDNNIFANKLSAENFKNIFQSANEPLFNRAVSGMYPPGSVIKPIIAAAALEENVIDPQKKIFSAGFIKIPNPFKPGTDSIFKDWKPLGWMDIRSALAYSSNVYFYSIGGGYEGQSGLGIERIKQYEKLFGLGEKTGIDFPNEAFGFIPDPLWKSSAKLTNPFWRIGDTYNVSIGQGDTLVTPLQVALYTAVFANGGVIYKPKLAQELSDLETNQIIKNFEPEIIRKNFINKNSIDIVREGMRMAVTEGSARRLGNLSVAVAGKTGTAETGRNNEAHAWFTGFAPYENPEIVLTVLVEKGGEGSAIAVPIAEEILAWYFEHNSSKP